MTQPAQGQAQANFADALVASGLVKNVKIAQKSQNPKNDSNADLTSPAVTKSSSQSSKKRSHSTMEFVSPQRTPNQLKSSQIEDIYIDRQLNAPLPKLKPEGAFNRDLMENASFRSEASSDISFLHDRPKKESVEITNEELNKAIPQNEPITFPRTVFAAQTIGKPQIASRATYENLNTLLRTLTADIDLDPKASEIDRIIGQRDAFDTVMSEIVRQGFFECSAKGDLFNNVRMYMTQAADQVPVLVNRLQKTKEHAQKKISALVSENDELNKKNESILENNKKLENQHQKMQKKLTFVENKIPQLEEETRKLRITTIQAEKKLEETMKKLEKSKEKRKKLQSENTDHSSIVEAMSNEIQSLCKFKVDAQKSIDTLAEENAKLQKINEELTNEIKILKEKLEDSQNQAIQLAKKPDLIDKLSQTELFAKRINRNKPKAIIATTDDYKVDPKNQQASHNEKQNNIHDTSSHENVQTVNNSENHQIKTIEKIKQLKNDYDACKEIVGDTISLESFDKLKEILLTRNGHFVPTNEKLMEAQDGSFSLDNENTKAQTDSIRLYAHTLMVRIMSKACQFPSKAEKSIQATEPKVAKIDQSTEIQQHELKQSEYKDNFTRLLDPTYSDRPPRTFEWMMKSIRSIFDEKTVKDNNDINEGKRPTAMPLFTLQWSMRQYGLDYLAHQCCWDLVNSARAHQYKAPEIEVFRKFLDEDYSTSQLTFFLRVRTVCLRRGITLTVKSKESDEQYNEVFLTTQTAIEIAEKVFAKAGQTVIDMITRVIKDDIVRKPSNKVDQSVTYVSMISLLNRSIEAFLNYEMIELKKLMSCFQIKPRMDNQHFKQLVKELIPTATDQNTSELYRLMLSSQVEKTLVTKKKFVAQFMARSLLSKENTSEVFEIDKMQTPTPEFENVKEKWKSLILVLDQELDKAENREKDPVLIHEMQCLRLEIDNVNGALTCYDAFGALRNILSCILAYQTLNWTLNAPQFSEMNEITDSIRNILRI
ncbi:hypothetical protein TRFO_31320 [Tritrichomonas foetus]|uniref:Uncharacterized protein n=1 Tax=Tritrichomonas foetus TaxID=1144522 RepID=A0A1J4JW54_9EUKA|nr:hypothetical protein TRFO_31320 [Tritrichomonas foetus]|eukprot:OHT01756.1 hypothetical protein TRFO_31320 [Tritrichomonas foetus]